MKKQFQRPAKNAEKRLAASQSKHSGPTPSSLVAIVERPWFPILLYTLLAFVYFSHFLATDDVIVGSDTGTEFSAGRESFTEKMHSVAPPNWSRSLGGTSGATALRASYFFPVQFIYFFTSHHRYLGWRYVIAMIVAGYAMFLYTKTLRIRRFAALLAGVAYQSAPAFLSFTYAGHFAKMGVISLLPFLFWAAENLISTRRLVYVFAFATVLALDVYTPHLQLVYFSLWGIGLYALCRIIVSYHRERSASLLLHRTGLMVLAVVLGLSVGAEGVFPSYWNTKTESKRAGTDGTGVSSEYASSWSLHPEEVASLVVPEFGNHLEHYWGRNYFKINSDYVGLIPLLLACLALPRIRKNPHVAFFVCLFVLAIAYGLGAHTPVHRLFYLLVPGVRVLRAPGTIMILALFAACVLGAFGTQHLFESAQSRVSRPKTTRRFLQIAIPSVVVLLIAAMNPQPLLDLWIALFYSDIGPQQRETMLASIPDLRRGLVLAAVLCSLIFTLVDRVRKGRIEASGFALCLLPLLILDTWRIDKQFLVYANPVDYPETQTINSEVIRFLKNDASLYRVLPLPDYRRVRLPDVDVVTGFSDFTLKRYDAIVRPEHLQHLPILNLLNTKYIVSSDSLDLPGLPEVFRSSDLRVYQNALAFPWFYLAKAARVERDEERILELLEQPGFRPKETVLLEQEVRLPPGNEEDVAEEIEQVRYDDRQGYIKLKVRCPGPRFLVVSENYHPDWRASIDGKEVDIVRANYVWKAVPLPEGEHVVLFWYRSEIASICRWVTLVSLLGVFAGLLATSPYASRIMGTINRRHWWKR